MSDNPIEVLKEKISGMTMAQRKVADYIIKNHLEVAFMTIEHLGVIVGTSTTTIMRLMNYLGYSGYSQFQKGLQELLRNKVNPKTKLEVGLKEMVQKDLWAQCYDRQMKNIQDTIKMLSTERLDETVQKIMDARRIYFVCARGGFGVARYLTDFFNRMLNHCQLIHADLLTEWTNLLPDMDNKTLIVAISYPRYAARLVQLLKLAKSRGAEVISITDGYASPLAAVSDFILPCSCESMGFHNSPVSSMFIADCLISVAALRNSAVVKERLDRANRIVAELDYYTI